MKNRIFAYIGVISIVMANLLLIMVACWAWYPYEPLQLNSNYLPTDKVSYKVGDRLYYEFDYCKKIDKSVLIHKSFVDGVLYNLPDIKGNFATGCHKTKIAVDIPNLLAGTYKIRVEYIYQVNPIREVTVVTETNSFNIIE